MTSERVLFALLRGVVCGESVTEEVKAACTSETLKKVYILAQKHDLAHLPGHAIGKLDVPDCDAVKAMKNATLMAVYRHTQKDYEFARICDVFEQAQIPFIPLKGAVVQDFYPEPWMRTSCDIDILVHEEDLERAAEALTSGLSYTTDWKKHYHDMSLFSPGGIHLELHFSIQETMENIDWLLGRVWDYATPVTQYRYILEKEYFVFHIIAHMSYHFVGGGCGIRPLLDLFLLCRQAFYDEAELRSYLAQCGIEKFYDSVLALIEVWFQGGSQTTITKRMERFLLSGGTYGSQEQRLAIQQRRQGGKLGYLLGRIFVPFRVLKIRYRILERWPILFPVMQIFRWVELFFGDGLERALKEAQLNWQTEDEQSAEMNAFLREIGL